MASGLFNVTDPWPAEFRLSALTGDWGLYTIPGPISLGVLHNVRNSLADGRNVRAVDANQRALMQTDDRTTCGKLAQNGSAIACATQISSTTALMGRPDNERCVYLTRASFAPN